MNEIPPLISSVSVPVAPDEAFREFTENFGQWWPPEFSWSQPELLEMIEMEPVVGGMLHEIGPHGFSIDWGRIIALEPGASLSFLWQIGADRVPIPDPERASIVDVRFTEHDGATTVTVEHHSWERHGQGAADYRNDFEQAWPMALERYRQHVAG